MSDFYSEAAKGPHEVFELGDFELESGAVLPGARILYKTHGQLNEARDNAILYPHVYSGTPSSLEPTIAPGRALDPERYFVVCPGQLGNGFSTSPSNAPPPFGGSGFPELTVGDDAVAQHRLLTEGLGIERVALAAGFSMGAQQAYELAVRHPEAVRRLAAIAGTARTTPHNALAVSLAEEALRADPCWSGGNYERAADVREGLRLHARVWSVTGLSPALFRDEAWREAGFASVGDLVTRLFEDDFGPMDPNNLLCMCGKWRRADVSRLTGGDLAAALARIEGPVAVIAFSSDLLFPPEDLEAERRLLPDGQLRVVDSPWGHYAFEMTEGARAALDRHLAELLAAPAP